MQRIESSDNKKIKRLTSLKQKKVRLKENLFLMEGLKSISEAVSSDASVDMILVSDHFLETNGEFCDQLEKTEYSLYVVKDHIFNKCSSLKTPQGIIAAISKPNNSPESIINTKKPIVILDGINDPGNLGTIIRTADAFGFGGVLLLPGCADPYSPKVVQSTMGSILRVECSETGDDGFMALNENGYDIYGMDLNGTKMSGFRFQDDKTAVIIGSESHGLSALAKEKCSKLLKINMTGRTESLNAAVAAGVVMHKVMNDIYAL